LSYWCIDELLLSHHTHLLHRHGREFCSEDLVFGEEEEVKAGLFKLHQDAWLFIPTNVTHQFESSILVNYLKFWTDYEWHGNGD
jgi:hypothetical protein